MLRHLTTGVLAITILATGFLRDFFGTNLIYQTYYTRHEKFNPHLPDLLDFYRSFTLDDIYIAKWVITIVFSLIYAGLALLLVRHLYRHREYLWWTVYAYGGLIVVSAVFFLGGYAIGKPNEGYYFSRVFMGFVQSPIVPMILIPAFRLLPPPDKTAA
ncbi:MAG: hypothetical protein AAGB22_08165 [Bacteroidota bacterium]